MQLLLHPSHHSAIFKNQKVLSIPVKGRQYWSLQVEEQNNAEYTNIDYKTAWNWSEQVEEINILQCSSICLLEASVQTNKIPTVIKLFIFTRHHVPTSLVIAQSVLLLGSLGLLHKSWRTSRAKSKRIQNNEIDHKHACHMNKKIKHKAPMKHYFVEHLYD